MNYRNTPHSSTGQNPASIMMNRGIKTEILPIIAAPTTAAHKEAQQKDAVAKARQKEYADKPLTNASFSHLVNGDRSCSKTTYRHLIYVLPTPLTWVECNYQQHG